EAVLLSEGNGRHGTPSHESHACECLGHLACISAVQRFRLVRRDSELDDHAPNSHRNRRRKGEAYLIAEPKNREALQARLSQQLLPDVIPAAWIKYECAKVIKDDAKCREFLFRKRHPFLEFIEVSQESIRNALQRHFLPDHVRLHTGAKRDGMR